MKEPTNWEKEMCDILANSWRPNKKGEMIIYAGDIKFFIKSQKELSYKEGVEEGKIDANCWEAVKEAYKQGVKETLDKIKLKIEKPYYHWGIGATLKKSGYYLAINDLNNLKKSIR